MMMAAARHFIYRGGGRNAIPRDATHVTIDESVTVIPAGLFWRHPNIVELICHAGVKIIEKFAFERCPRLKRVIIPGVEDVEEKAFLGCEAVIDIECPKLERIDFCAFDSCKSLHDINLPSAKVVQGYAFYECEVLTDVKFGKKLETIRGRAFTYCHSLERITIPLKNGLFTEGDNDLFTPLDIFQECTNLKRVDIVEGEVLRDTIDALLFEEWGNDINEQVNSINHILPNTPAGYYDDEEDGNMGEKAQTIQAWITRVLRKIIHYKAQHRSILDSVTSMLHLVLPNDIVINNVLPLLKLPSYNFEGEEEEF